ncbi:MAG TPA: endonuclease/exonuclease/phosphatase family protein [Verrucomicrobiota bacterium]|nr:endonuclease [Verrucomicrobiales bacterium]HRI16706.1 endonuclease/exonuclease/phosphatase family protein [Verrucomicrobiota bacterium]
MTSRRRFLGALATAPLATSLVSAQAPPGGTSSPNELAVMTYNLRYASDRPPNDWPTRRPIMQALVRQYAPDVMGTQEGLYPQLTGLAAGLPDYQWIGLGRDGGSRGEFMAVFYRPERLEPLEYDHFWLSDTPEVIASSTWGNTNRRMVTWVRFRDKRVGREFYFWNTHLDHQIQTAREKAAALILERIHSKTEAKLPLLLVGDFNAVARENPVYDQLVTTEGLQDTWFLAETRRNEAVNSFNDFGTKREESKRIDWILARGALQVRAAEVITFAQNNQWPSDHFPVMAWLTWK